MKNPMNALKQLFTKTITNVVNTFKKPFLKEVEKVARKEGISQTYDKITAKHASIVWIISRCTAFLQSTDNTILEDIEKAFSSYQQISNDFFKNSSLQDLRLQKDQLLEELQHKITQMTVHINTQKEAIEQQIVELTTLLKHDRIDIKNYPKIDVRWKIFIAGVLIAGIVFAETFSNLQSFLAIPNEPFVRALLLAVGISFGTYTMGAWFVKILQNQLNFGLEKNLKTIAVTNIILLAYLGISFYRQDAMQIVHTSDD